MRFKKFFSKLGKNKRRIFLFGTIALFVLMAQAWLIFQLKFDKPEAGAEAEQVAAVNSATPSFTLTPQEITVSPGVRINVPILMYHHIESVPRAEDDPIRALSVSKEKFEGHLEYLRKEGYGAVALTDLYRKIAAGEATDKTVVLTFDDGYLDNFEVAWPIMQKYDFKGTFFVISNRIGTAGYMNEEQVKTLQDAGNEIGSHSLSHPDLTRLSDKRLKEEIEGSKKEIGEIIGKNVFSFCYPTGKFNARVSSAIQNAGYKFAVTTRRWQPFSTDNPFEVPRYRVNSNTNLENLLNR